MKHDENLPIDPELEARIVAWVLGECSPFEAAELERRIATNPELAIFKRRIEAVHGLVGEAVRPEPAKLKLSGDRRAKLLATIGVPAGNDAGTVMALKPLGSERRRRFPIWLPAIAACLVVGFVVFQTSKRNDMQLLRMEESQATGGRPVELPAIRDVPIEQEARERAVAEATADKKEKSRVAAQQRRIMGGRTPAAPRATWSASQQAGAGALQQASDAAQLQMSPTPDATFSFKASKPEPPRTVNGSLLTIGGKFQTEGAASFGTASAPVADNYIANDDNPVKLSPFEVQGTREAGYTASSTLAGTRLRLDAKDISIPLSVTTTAALADTGSKPKRRSFGYAGYTAAPPPKTEDAQSFLAVSVTDLKESDQPIAHKAVPVPAAAQMEKKANIDAVSTFSLHVSDVSFKLAQAAVARGERPDPASIRPEEFYNAFDYGDPAPAANEPVACRIEQAAHPFLQQRNFVRIAMRVPAVGRAAAQPLRLTLLIDTSGSMEREDRTSSVQRAFEVLASLLGPNDQVTLIGFARQPRLLAERVRGSDAGKLAAIVRRTPPEGGTNLEEALKLAGEKARAQFDPNAQNRIVVLSDGAANLGNDDPVALSNAVAALRAEGISFDACGIGVRGLDDSILESLTRKGDGRYYVINSADEADAGFARKLAGALHPAAQNVKVQVRFNPARVQSYRLIGFEQHRLREEDFRNDKVSAAELAGDEAAVALYEVQANPDGDGELGEVFVRFRDTATGNMVERSWTALYDAHAPAFDRASPSMQLAGAAALLAEKLQGGPAAKTIRLSDLASELTAVRAHYAQNRRIQDFVTMFGEARRLFGE